MWLWGSICIIMVVCIILFFLGFFLSMVSGKYRDGGSCYECGFEPIRTTRSSFSLRFFLLGVLFVVFDVEVVIIVPILLSLGGGSSVEGVWCLVLFICVLVLGCLYERRDGSIDWVSET